MEPTPTLSLDDPRAADVGLVGAKAANLARARQAGMPVLPGLVLPVGARAGTGERAALGHVWSEFSRDGERTLVARSSATIEDGMQSSMAGMFTSVLGITSRSGFHEAVHEVIASADGHDVMAVLIQPQLDAAAGGVMFGADPVDGRRDHIIVAASTDGPQALVGGTVTGTRYVLTRRGRVLSTERDTGSGTLTDRQLRELARLVRRCERVFGSPQDVEFGFDHDAHLWLLQSRPVTALAPPPARRAPLLGPGPVAETLPGALTPLEDDLWAVPMDRGVTDALGRLGAAPRRRLRRRGVVITVGGRVAADLALLGALPTRRRRLRLLDPRPGIRRLGAAWRVGTLRTTLPGVVTNAVASIDADLADVPPVAELTAADLGAGLRWCQATLAALHSLEALAGALLAEENNDATAAAIAVATLQRGRAHGWNEDRILATEPTVLALVPPAIGPVPRLPDLPPDETTGSPILPARERLRLRIRWTQELGARLAWEAGRQLTGTGTLSRQEHLRWLRLTELLAVLEEGAPAPATLEHRANRPQPPPLPTMFRLAGQRVVAESADPDATGTGQAAGGGRGAGVVTHDVDRPPPPGAVLVVRTLEPRLAAYLPGLAGLVSESGSVLSHLAIMARERGVPVVVGEREALERLRPGTHVIVDGDAGIVDALAGEEHRT